MTCSHTMSKDNTQYQITDPSYRFDYCKQVRACFLTLSISIYGISKFNNKLIWVYNFRVPWFVLIKFNENSTMIQSLYHIPWFTLTIGKHAIPIMIHGDYCEFTHNTQNSLMVASWRPLLHTRFEFGTCLRMTSIFSPRGLAWPAF